jgi:cysteine-S-conjugate beta-lyase
VSRRFDTVDEARLRSGYGVKWGSLPEDTIGAWVADMDFGIPPAVSQAVREVVDREDLGYPHQRGGDPVVTAFEDWMRTRHQWRPAPGRTRVFTDLIQVLQVMIEYTTAPGDGVAIHVPSYPPFLASIARSGRRIVPIPMLDGPDGWSFDTHGLASRLGKAGCGMLVLVNPHNPTGRVFRRHELEAIAAAAEELDLVVISDEIHADLVYTPNTHIPFASLNEAVAGRTVTTTSATKTFNIAGMRCAVAHIGPDRLASALDAAPRDYFGQPSILSRVATVAAWRDSQDWHTDLMAALSYNRDTLTSWVAAQPAITSYHPPQATYLAWFDVQALAPGPEPARRLEASSKVRLTEGAELSDGTDVDTAGFVRLNFATSNANLRRILGRIVPDGQARPA